MAIKPLPSDQHAFVGTDGKPVTVFYTWLKSLAEALNGLLALFPGGTSTTAWTTYTPTATAATGLITSYTASGSYYQIGKTVFFQLIITITNAGTGVGDLIVTMPLPTSIDQFLGGIETISSISVIAEILASDDKAHISKYDGTTAIFTGNRLICTGTYEAA